MDNVKRILDRLDEVLLNAGSDNLLAENQFDLDDLNEFINDCFMIKIEDGNVGSANIFRFSFLGDNLISAFSDSNFAEDINSLILPTNHAIADNIKKVIETKKTVRTFR